MVNIFLVLANYLLGSFSSALVITKLKIRKDIRMIGYKTAGGSNVSKTLGIFWGTFVGLIDILKGIPILIVAKNLNVNEYAQVFIGLSAILGHCWPIWFNFDGGRGIATFLGVMTVLTPKISIIPLLIFTSTIIPSILARKKILNLKLISSPTLTLLSLLVYLYLTKTTNTISDDLFALFSLFIILLRRTTARIDEYCGAQNKLSFFLHRLIFDSNPKKNTPS